MLKKIILLIAVVMLSGCSALASSGCKGEIKGKEPSYTNGEVPKGSKCNELDVALLVGDALFDWFGSSDKDKQRTLEKHENKNKEYPMPEYDD